MPIRARIYIAATCSAGLAVVAYSLLHWDSQNGLRFSLYLLCALLGFALKVTLPGITGTMSVGFLFILIGIVEMRLAEVLAIGCAGALVQCLWQPRVKPKPVQVLFNISGNALAIAAAYYAYHAPLAARLGNSLPILLMLAASVYFVVNTLSVAVVISLTELKPVRKTWHDCYFWSFPYYLVGASIAWLVSLMEWQTAMVVIPVIYFIYRSYKLYLSRLESERNHVEEMARLHLRTIEALALAIEAKDFNTHDHLRRVRVYAIELGKEMNLSEGDLEALRAAAVLHDIGKLAVPEHIISKPGKLTPEEFEKMKIHPVVGGEILEQVQFPYPVVPIVRAHHENWDGSGYPDGLKGEEIPLGARILAAVDCLDALASDRHYRRALPLDKAMEIVVSESGRAFDPRVVEVLHRRYLSLEPMAVAQTQEKTKLSTDVKITRGAAPGAGFETEAPVPRIPEPNPALTSIAAARQEAQMLFELTQDLGNSLSLDETLSVIAARLKHMIPYESIAVYVMRDDKLVPAYVNGEDYRLFASLEIPVGEGLSGWVAENAKPILNGNPAVESGYLNDASRFSQLRSALAVPLQGVNQVVGVLSLYRSEREGFSRDHLRMLLAVNSKMSMAIENALKYRQAESSATTDYLTNLPNARSLFLRLDSELARCQRERHSLAVLVGDLDGFKQLNDELGHLEGNRVLRLVADALQSGCRQYDYVARMGGDEFVMIFPGLRPEAVGEKIARLQQIAGTATSQASGGHLIGMSLGAATYPEDGADAEQLLAEADRRMFKAKQARKMTRQRPPEQPFTSTPMLQ